MITNWIKQFIKAEISPYNAITDIWSHRFNIIMNSLDTDLIQTYTFYILHLMLTNTNKKIVVSSPKWENCEELLTELNYHFKKILRYFPEIEIINNQSKVKGIILNNGCEVNMYKTHKYSYINEDIDVVIIMDMAHAIPSDMENFFKLCVVLQSSKPNGRIIINSTPNGHNLFYEVFTQAEAGKNIFKPFRLYYWMDGKKDYEWVREKINSIGEERFNLQYNCVVKKKK